MLKLMIVDDEPDLAGMLKSRFERLNYIIILAENGQVALEKARTYNPDIIILDIHMPVMDGFQFLEALRKSDMKAQHAAVIVLSARRKMRDSFDPKAIIDFIEKPFDAKDLVRKVDETAEVLRKQKEIICRCLLIGMDWDVMRPIRKLLDARQIITYTAQNGPAALEEAVRRKPDLIISASLVAGMDIFQLRKLFADMATTKKVPFVIYDSAGHFGGGRSTLKDVHIIDYQQHDDLVTKIDEYLRAFFMSR